MILAFLTDETPLLESLGTSAVSAAALSEPDVLCDDFGLSSGPVCSFSINNTQIKYYFFIIINKLDIDLGLDPKIFRLIKGL